MVWSSKTLTTPRRLFRSRCRGSPGPVAVLARSRACRRPRLQVERHRSLQHALDVRCRRSSFPASRASSAGRRSRALRAMTSGSETSAQTRGMATRFVGKVISTITTVADEREYYDPSCARTRRRVARPCAATALRVDEQRPSARLLRPVEHAIHWPHYSEPAGVRLTPRRSCIPFRPTPRPGARMPGEHRPMPAFVLLATTGTSSTASTSPLTATA